MSATNSTPLAPVTGKRKRTAISSYTELDATIDRLVDEYLEGKDDTVVASDSGDDEDDDPSFDTCPKAR